MSLRSILLMILTVFPGSLLPQNQLITGYTPKPDFVAGVGQPVMNLNGPWNFCAVPGPGFWKSPDPSKNRWSQINVPGEWTMQGHVVKPGERAAYWKELLIPDDWKGKRVIIKADGLYSDAKVYLNGKFAGSHEGGFTPAELDLSGHIKPGRKNHLVIGLVSESLADTLASATQYAAHQLGGITRKIELFALPEAHLIKADVSTDLDDLYQDAFLNIDLGISKSPKSVIDDLTVEIKLYRIDNELAPVFDKTIPLEPFVSGTAHEQKISLRIFNPDKWDPEHPNLYRLMIALKTGNQEIERLNRRFGFKETVVAGNQVFVNGMPIKLRGVCHHEVHPAKGRSLGMEEWEADVRLFKEANVNYIRTSHYPPAEEFIDLCDSAGLFVELEAPHCWVGHGANTQWINANPHDMKLFGLIRQQVLETVAQYRNHPSVLIWSMANESAWGPIWDSILREVNAINPTRPVSFHDQAYGGYNNHGSSAVQIANFHYPGPSGPDMARKYNRPMLFGEYCHLNCYNRQELAADPGIRDTWGRGLEAMWEDIYYSAGNLGGAIWSGVDDVFYLPSGKAVGYGEWGPIDGWRRPKPEYWHMKKTYSPVKIHISSMPVPEYGQPIRIPVENRWLFSDLSEMEFHWRLGTGKGQVSVQASPGQSGILTINPLARVRPEDELEISVWSPQKYLVDSYIIRFGTPMTAPSIPAVKSTPELVIQGNRVLVSFSGLECVFDALTGGILECGKPGKPVLTGGPELQMLPLSTGPCVTDYQLDIAPLNNTCTDWKGRLTGSGKEGGNVWIEVEGQYAEADLRLKYLFDTLGYININYELISKIDINPRQIGLVFSLPGEFDQLFWERKAQWSVYPDDHIGRPQGMAAPFSDGGRGVFRFGVKPEWGWSADVSPMGSNDFRATRENIFYASLNNADNLGLTITSPGKDAVRCWIGEGSTHMLVAAFNTGGGDLFFASHHEKERKPLRKGDKFAGQVGMFIN